MPIRNCPCGSGKPRVAVHDACGIFCCFVCEDCEAKKLSRFDPIIFTNRARSHYVENGEDVDGD